VGYEEISDPHEIIHVTLRELGRSLGVLAQGKVVASDVRNSHMTRAFTAIYILQSSLDFDAGGEIAVNLFRIYEYCRTQLTLAFRRDPAANLEKCVAFIDEITTAWGDISNKAG
jgi:flagellar protein FliS